MPAPSYGGIIKEFCMKKVIKWVGIIAFMAVIVFSMVGCGFDCIECGGSGKCNKCKGTGYIPKGICPTCNGSGYCQNCGGDGKVLDVWRY